MISDPDRVAAVRLSAADGVDATAATAAEAGWPTADLADYDRLFGLEGRSPQDHETHRGDERR